MQFIRSPRWPLFAERGLWNVGVELRDYSALMPENLITLAHFSVSSAVNLPNSAGVIGMGTPPSSAMRVLIVGSANAARTVGLMVATMSVGVFLGAQRAYHWLASKPGSTSATIGTSGNASEREAVVTASARSLLAFIYSIAAGMVAKISCTWPPIRSVSAGPSPR